MLIAAATNATTTGGTSSGGSAFLLFLLVGVGLLWLLVVRPKRRMQREQRGMQSYLAVGDEILTAGGVYGKVTQVGDDEVRVEIAPNVEIRLARRAIAAHLTEHPPTEAEQVAAAEPDDASDERWQSAFDAESGEEKPG